MKNRIRFILAIMGLVSAPAFASTCADLQRAEESITEVAYFDGARAHERIFCYYLARALHSSQGRAVGLDGLAMGGVSFCTQAVTEVQPRALVAEVREAMGAVKDCYSNIGQD